MAGNYFLTPEAVNQRIKEMLQRAEHYTASAAQPIVVSSDELAARITKQEKTDRDRLLRARRQNE